MVAAVDSYRNGRREAAQTATVDSLDDSYTSWNTVMQEIMQECIGMKKSIALSKKPAQIEMRKGRNSIKSMWKDGK